MARKIGMFDAFGRSTGSPEPRKEWKRPERTVARLWNNGKLDCAVDLLKSMNLHPGDWSAVEKSKITRRLKGLRLGTVA